MTVTKSISDCHQVNEVLRQHKSKVAEHFSDDSLYRHLVTESLLIVQMATSAVQVLLAPLLVLLSAKVSPITNFAAVDQKLLSWLQRH